MDLGRTTAPRDSDGVLSTPPFCPTGAAVDLDVATVDLGRLCDSPLFGQRREDAGPDAPPAPPVPAIVDRGGRAILRPDILLAAASLQHVDDPQDHPTVVSATRPSLVLRQVQCNRRSSLIRQPSPERTWGIPV